jgi:hypothetical protein
MNAAWVEGGEKVRDGEFTRKEPIAKLGRGDI